MRTLLCLWCQGMYILVHYRITFDANIAGLRFMPGNDHKITPLAALVAALAMGLAAPAVSAESADTAPAATASADANAARASMRSYESNLELIETQQGAYGADLPETLFGMGLALQSQGRHDEAIALFKRGVHLNRVNYGLYSDTQIPLIQAEIKSHLAQRDYSSADDRQAYLYRVQMHVAGEDGPKADAYMQQADWQYAAYRSGIGQYDYTRLMNMWDLYRAALTETAEREGNVSPNLKPPLEGMLQTLYLMADYQFPQQGMSSNEDITARVSLNRFTAYRAQSYERGSTVIATLRELELNNSNPETAAENLVMLGDWHLWNGKKNAAWEAYAEAYGELAGLGAAQDSDTPGSTEPAQESKQESTHENDAVGDGDNAEGDSEAIREVAALAEPVPLPDFADLQPLPMVATPEEGNILLEFGVTATGKVVDLERLDENEALDGKANRLMRKLRRTTFRPRFEAGQAVASENVTRSFYIRQQ